MVRNTLDCKHTKPLDERRLATFPHPQSTLPLRAATISHCGDPMGAPPLLLVSWLPESWRKQTTIEHCLFGFRPKRYAHPKATYDSE